MNDAEIFLSSQCSTVEHKKDCSMDNGAWNGTASVVIYKIDQRKDEKGKNWFRVRCECCGGATQPISEDELGDWKPS